MAKKSRILFVSSEMAPYAKTGGLADAVAGLARHLAKRGHDVRVAIPLYRDSRERIATLSPILDSMGVRMGDKEEWCAVRSVRPDGEGG